MLHFASSSSRPADRRISQLNATQTKSSSEPEFLAIEEELHDARRVQAHGQEDDLRAALGMVIARVVQMSTQLQEALKAKTELETQLGVAKSNLKLVIANNEMLEEAIGNARDVGWRRGTPRQQQGSTDSVPRRSESQSRAATPALKEEPSSPPSPSTAGGAKEDSRFFKFRFNSSSSNLATSTRPATPNGHTPSPSIPSSRGPSVDQERELEREKELEERENKLKELQAELEKEREAHIHAKEQRASLEAEIESLSAALFEEANKMVAAERIRLHEVQEELNETRQEKEALRSALKLIEGENRHLRNSSSSVSLHSRSSSNVGMISPRESPQPADIPLPPTPPPSGQDTPPVVLPEVSTPTPVRVPLPTEESPWASQESRMLQYMPTFST